MISVLLTGSTGYIGRRLDQTALTLYWFFVVKILTIRYLELKLYIKIYLVIS
jgi:hypothetical protein